MKMHHDLRAILRLILKHLVAARSIIELESVANDDGWIDVAFFNVIQKRLHIPMRMGLTHLEFDTFVESHSKIEVVDKPDVDARYGNDSCFSHAMNRLP